MMYECRNRLGERIGHAYTKQQAEEMIRHANWLLDQKRGTPEYEQRVVRAQKAEEKEMYLQPIVTQYLVCNKSEIWP